MRTPLRWLMLSLYLQAGASMATELHFVTEDFPPFTYALGEPSSTGEGTRAAGPLAEIVQAYARAFSTVAGSISTPGVEPCPWPNAAKQTVSSRWCVRPGARPSCASRACW